MPIDGINGATSATASSPPGRNVLNGTKDEFLKLFMAQLQHQDPFDPKSNSDMVAQLAQFSSVEQQTQTNQRLEDLTTAQASSSNASLASLVGRTCDAVAGAFQLVSNGQRPPAIDLSCSGNLRGCEVTINGPDGKELRKLTVPDGPAPATIAWDGRDSTGMKCPAGNYTISVKTADGNSVTPTWHGRVDALELTPDGPRLRMGDVLIMPGDIASIGAGP